MLRYKQVEDFLNRTPATQEKIPMIDKQDFMKFRSFYTAKETSNQVKKQYKMGQSLYHLPLILTNRINIWNMPRI